MGYVGVCQLRTFQSDNHFIRVKDNFAHFKMAFDHIVDFHSARSMQWDPCWKADVTTNSHWKEIHVPVQAAHFYQQMETDIPRNKI